MAERETFVEFRSSLVLAGALAGLGFGMGPSGSEGVDWVHEFRAWHWEVWFHRGIWTVDFPVAELGLMFLCLF